ncbi:MAG: acyltransferase [Spirochaetaceae bacterium]|nr:acyltransferase [Spirochaetaceae bacterium]
MEKADNVLFLDEFKEIEPYRGDIFTAALKRLKNSKILIKALRKTVFSKAPFIFNPILNLLIKIYIRYTLKGVDTPSKFQLTVIKIIVGTVVKKTISEMTYSGLEKLDFHKHHSLLISNHRDITLDPALASHAIATNNMPVFEVAFGDNLLVNDLVADLIRINKGFIVKRNQPPREQLKSTVTLSKYIWYALNTHDSVWLAQREGRAKNGDDITNPALIKMLYLSQRKDGLEFSDFINKLKIVPLVLSYEFDPCDKLKARELYRRDTNNNYKKRKNEDFLSMVHGITSFKGRVHLVFGEVLRGTWNDPKDVADAIDAFVHTNYRLWPSNYLAYDILHSTDKYASKYDAKYKESFIKRFCKLPDKIKIYAYQAYSKPVENAEKYQDQ